ncbi:MAG: polymorphic toxin type 8 domain-containing protein, partial [Burkholderiaceae bacterium]
ANSTPPLATLEQMRAAEARSATMKSMAGKAAGVGLIAIDLANTPVSPGPDVGLVGAGLLARSAAVSAGRAGRTQRLGEIAADPKTASRIRGWLTQERNHMRRGDRTSVRVPPGHELAHTRGFEAAKGYSHATGKSTLIPRTLHHLKHKVDDYGKRNKDMGKPPAKR